LLAGTYHNIGRAHYYTGAKDKSEEAFRLAVTIRQALIQEQPELIDYALALVNSQGNLGAVLIERGKSKDALTEALDPAVKQLKEILESQPGHAKARHVLCDLRVRRADAFARLGRFKDAVSEWDQAIRLEAGPRLVDLKISRATIWIQLGDLEKALAEAKSIEPEARTGMSCFNLACVYALSAAALEKGASRAPADRSITAESCGCAAVALLRRAHAAGFFRTPAYHEALKADTDLQVLRLRTDFQKLLSEVNASLAPSL
jgi:tetratricopeptide (TPR) repeat protein